MQVIRVVLFGMGNMGRNHFRVLQEDSRYHLLAVVDPVLEGLPGSDIPLLRTVDEALALPWDLAVVAAPTELHYALVKKILEHDRHVLVEKPAAGTMQEARELVQIANDRSLRLAVGNIERCNPVVGALRRLIHSGILGQLVHLTGTRAGGFPRNVKPGNNVILDLAVHELDVFRMLLGPLQVLNSIGHSTQIQNIFDTAEILVSGPQGATGSVHVNWLTPQRLRSIRVTGTDAVCTVDYIAQTCEITGLGLRGRVADVLPELQWFDSHGALDRAMLPVEKQETLKIQLNQMHRFLFGQDHHLATQEELVESVQLVEMAVELAQQRSRPRTETSAPIQFI
ncbi:MAG TPA: Gfo/Idh/MocA family oxidoreductase [Oligoflexus sp.]|uniref:Gfo/Idh/MocA family protein n=1 Tax=Oligoflexus sp. TaxID=1971216 RepID=UPI002D6AD14F|nr:Gfo/Idh/MocA family oxidoreductase [Oligoflexus sp.]HYX37016.1 Gfo/Idh/MocA family oxidoreductase [Oligoflexus sp.]